MLDQDRLKELLHYDPETGVFTWRVDRGSVKAGSEAGCVHSNGYHLIKVCKKIFYAHRLVFLYMTGGWPSQHVDHINGKKRDNRWFNLRDVDVGMNSQNERSPRVNNKSGFLGVCLISGSSGKPYRAQIGLPGGAGKTKNLGRYATPEEAHEAYLAAKRRLHKGCTV